MLAETPEAAGAEAVSAAAGVIDPDREARLRDPSCCTRVSGAFAV